MVTHRFSLTAASTLGLGAIGAVLALTFTSPSAYADTVDLPDEPLTGTSPLTDYEVAGLPPLYAEESFEQPGGYTDLLGHDTINNLAWNEIVAGPANFVDYQHSFESLQVVDPATYTAGGLTFDGSTYDLTSLAGVWNIYESTPIPSVPTEEGFIPWHDNVSDTFLFDPTGSPYADLSGVEFGIQYVDLPDAATPVDAINLLGAGGEILYSIPVTGDLLTSF